MMPSALSAPAKRYAILVSDRERIHQALYQGSTETFCPFCSTLTYAILRERYSGLLSDDAFECMLDVAADPLKRDLLFSLFKVATPRDMPCV